MIRIDCTKPEGNAFHIIGAVRRHLRSQRVPDETIRKFTDMLQSSASYWELLDAAITITEGEIDFINIPRKQ